MSGELAIVLLVVGIFGLIGWLGSMKKGPRELMGKDWTDRL